MSAMLVIVMAFYFLAYAGIGEIIEPVFQSFFFPYATLSYTQVRLPSAHSGF